MFKVRFDALKPFNPGGNGFPGEIVVLGEPLAGMTVVAFPSVSISSRSTQKSPSAEEGVGKNQPRGEVCGGH